MLHRLNQFTALLLVTLLANGTVQAGVTFTVSNGITATGADGVNYTGANGITATGADGVLTFPVNGITATGADGITATGADGITATGADGVTHTGANGITATGADGITATGADGVTIRTAAGQIYRVLTARVMQPNGITATGADGITATGADGITATGADGVTIAYSNGITATGVDSIAFNSANGITATGADGSMFQLSAQGVVISDIEALSGVGVRSLSISGADTIRPLIPVLEPAHNGIQSLDPELAWHLNQVTDDSGLNAIISFHRAPTASELAYLQSLGVTGGTLYRVLPMVVVVATKAQLIAISKMPGVRSIYGQRTLNFTSHQQLGITGLNRAETDSDLLNRNGNTPYSGRNVTVAVLDTGLDGTHPDLAGRVAQNVRLQDTAGAGAGFNPPVFLENQSNTDFVNGHGTFVAGVVGGTGGRSNGRFSGIAPHANLLGMSAGDQNLLFVLAGFDYLLYRGANYNVRAVNCSFSANTVFDVNDPVNIATKMLTERNINVVFSAGNTGPGLHTLNPYSVAPWVISVGATDERGQLAGFSSRGEFGSPLFRPTLVAPGVNLASLRSSLGATTALGVPGIVNTQPLTANELPYYTKASGTSFSAPQVAGAIALMLEANPTLRPAQVKAILQDTATPLPPYYQHEVGAGMLNIHAAVLSAAFPSRRIGAFRAGLDLGQVHYVKQPAVVFSGTLQPFSNAETQITIPEQTVMASVQIGWGGLTSLNDLGLSLTSPTGGVFNQPDELNLAGLTGKREREILTWPASGNWRVKVYNQPGASATTQPYRGLLETTSVKYDTLQDVAALDAVSRAEVYYNLRYFTMPAAGPVFGTNWPVRRGELAAALVIGGRVPQYLAATPWFSDVQDNTTRNYAESAQAAPGGALFYDATRGGSFRPQGNLTRLALAVALARAAGLATQAQSSILTTMDAAFVPTAWQGYAALALERGFLARQGSNFNPNNTVSRLEMARAMTKLMSTAP